MKMIQPVAVLLLLAGGTPAAFSQDAPVDEILESLPVGAGVCVHLGDGDYLVEGVKFHMAGAWELRVQVTDSEGSDGVAIELSLAQ